MSNIAEFEAKTKQASEEAHAANEEQCQYMENSSETITTKVNQVSIDVFIL